MKPDLIKELATAFKNCQNPTDLKPCIIGTVAKLEPLTIGIAENKIFLVENDNLLISEWFRFRCNIDKEGALSSDVPENLNNATSIKETHSYTGADCVMPNAVSYLAQAITSINNELLALKCNLQVGDFVIIASLEQEDGYLLIDKVLNDVSAE